MPLATRPPQPLKKGTLSAVSSAVRTGSLPPSFCWNAFSWSGPRLGYGQVPYLDPPPPWAGAAPGGSGETLVPAQPAVHPGWVFAVFLLHCTFCCSFPEQTSVARYRDVPPTLSHELFQDNSIPPRCIASLPTYTNTFYLNSTQNSMLLGRGALTPL